MELNIHVSQKELSWGLWNGFCFDSNWFLVSGITWSRREMHYVREMFIGYLLCIAGWKTNNTNSNGGNSSKDKHSYLGWVKDLSCILKTGMVQAQTVACWVAYLGQCSLSSLPLKEELQKILGLVTGYSNALWEVSAIPPENSLVQEGIHIIPEDP